MDSLEKYMTHKVKRLIELLENYQPIKFSPNDGRSFEDRVEIAKQYNQYKLCAVVLCMRRSTVEVLSALINVSFVISC
jgi:hypothetical protein